RTAARTSVRSQGRDSAARSKRFSCLKRSASRAARARSPRAREGHFEPSANGTSLAPRSRERAISEIQSAPLFDEEVIEVELKHANEHLTRDRRELKCHGRSR